MTTHYGTFRNLQTALQLNRGDTLQIKSVTGHYVPVRVQTFVQTTAPVAVAGSDLVPTVVLNSGDIWVDTSTVAREQYTWNGAAWVKNAIPSAGVNIKNSDGVTPLSQLSNLNANLGNITTGNIVSTVLDGGFNYSLWLNETATNSDVIAAGLSSLGKGSVPFRVSRAGVLYASGATISGAITATSGAIGGWTINSAYLAKDTGVDAASAGLAPLDFPFYAGATYANRASAPYRVTPAGALTASSANITGAITATSGSVGSFTIGTYLYSGSKTAYNDGLAGVHLGSDGIGLNNTFSVSAAGALAASSGTIGGWALDTNMLRSTGIGTARIELDQSAARISVKDAANASKTVMGYLNGLAKHDGTGNWGAGDYGFWAAAGDHLKIDGDARYKSGDWIVENDGSFLVQNASNTTIVRLGTLAGVKGLYLYDSTPTLLAKFATDGIYLGTAGGAANSLAYTVGGGLNIRGAITADTGYIGGTGGWTITAGKWYGGSGAAFSGSIQGTGATKSFFAGATDNAGTGAKYYVTADGALTATDVIVKSAGSGQRTEISTDPTNGEQRWYDSLNTLVGGIGVHTVGTFDTIASFGDITASARVGLWARSYSNRALLAYSIGHDAFYAQTDGVGRYAVSGLNSANGTAIYGESGAGVGVKGYASSGVGGNFSTTSGYAGIFTGGKVGIGTASPAATLSVGANSYINSGQNYDGANGWAGTRTATSWSDGTRRGSVQVSATNGGMAIGVETADDLSFFTNQSVGVTLKNGGNVGIGTASPNALLHVRKPASLLQNVGDENTLFQLGSDSYSNTYGGQFEFRERRYSSSVTGGHALALYGKNAANASLTADTFLLTVQANGNVGIGTASPGATLTVGRPAQTSYSRVANFYDAHATGIPYITVGKQDAEGADTCAVFAYDVSNNLMWLGVAGDSVGTGVHVKRGGKVGINSASPGAALSINGGLHVGGDSDPGDNNILVDGLITAPAQPAFLAYNSATDANVTGNGTQTTVDFDTEVFDQGNNFSADTFTAPVTGRYRFSTHVIVTGMTAATTIILVCTTSNRTVTLEQTSAAAKAGSVGLGGSVLCDMDAGDTAVIKITANGEGADTDDIFGTAATTTFFSGELVC